MRGFRALNQITVNVSRLVYSLAVAIVTPLVLLWASLRQRDFIRGFSRRLGFFLPNGNACVWVHAASVGEVQGVSPLVMRLLDRVRCPILFTTFTPAGAQQVKKQFGGKLLQSFVPWDTASSVKRFLRHYRPQLLIVMETEVWPNLYYYCQQQNIPIVIVNARLGDKAYRRYQKSPRLFRASFSGIKLVGARSKQDSERFQALGVAVEHVRITGNIKYVIDIDARIVKAGQQFKSQWERRIWLAASTHSGEDEIVLEAHRQLRLQFPDLLLILAPRHPQRANDIVSLMQQHRFSFAKRSQNQTVNADTAVLLVDTLGELRSFYSCADIAFVGGSLAPVGGHNPLEAAALECPIVSGRHIHNFRDEYELLGERSAVLFVENVDELAKAVAQRWQDKDRFVAMAKSARAMLEENQGSLTTTLSLIEAFLPN